MRLWAQVLYKKGVAGRGSWVKDWDGGSWVAYTLLCPVPPLPPLSSQHIPVAPQPGRAPCPKPRLVFLPLPPLNTSSAARFSFPVMQAPLVPPLALLPSALLSALPSPGFLTSCSPSKLSRSHTEPPLSLLPLPSSPRDSSSLLTSCHGHQPSSGCITPRDF